MNGHSEHCDQIPQQRRPYLNKRGICRGNALHHTKCHPRHGHGCVPRHSPLFPQHQPMGLMPPLPLSSERKSLGPVPSRQTRTTIQQIWQSVKAQAPGSGLRLRHSYRSTKGIGHSPVPRGYHPHHQRPQPPRQRKRVHLSKPGHSGPPLAGGTSRTTQPPPYSPARVHPEPPPPRGPHGGVCIDSSLHGDLYRLPDEPHTLNPDDLEEWGCAVALALLQSSPPETVSVYLDGSAGALGYGSVATLFFPSGARWVLCQPSPHQSSEGSEFWALVMPLRWALKSYSHLTFAILGDNLHVVSVLSPSFPPDQGIRLLWHNIAGYVQDGHAKTLTDAHG